MKVMRKAKLSVHVGDVKKVLSSFAIEVQAVSIEVVHNNGRIYKKMKSCFCSRKPWF